MSSKPTYTIIAPIYNEIENIQVLYQRVSEVMEGTGERWEFVMVDDGSTDGSTQAILDLKTKDDKIVPVIFARNFGHQIAVTAGLDHSQGEAVVIIDADLQDPPEVILDLIAKWKEGYEVVYAQRSKREGETWFKLFTAAAFYRTIQRITDVNLPMDTGDFRLLDRKVVDVMGDMREKHRFLRGMSVWVGFRQIGVEYERAERFAGETKYPLKKMFRLASDAITGFSYFPLQLATYLGFTAAGLGLLVLLVVIIARLAGSQFLAGQAVTVIVVLFLGGVQLISLGMVGEYVGRLYDEAKDRPLYILRKNPPEN
ncbi:MAG: glycosyltransferase [Chloroflexi bacterium]|nr:MAG: glycosyltransferase [Chloroflexota bacterium]